MIVFNLYYKLYAKIHASNNHRRFSGITPYSKLPREVYRQISLSYFRWKVLPSLLLSCYYMIYISTSISETVISTWENWWATSVFSQTVVTSMLNIWLNLTHFNQTIFILLLLISQTLSFLDKQSFTTLIYHVSCTPNVSSVGV